MKGKKHVYCDLPDTSKKGLARLGAKRLKAPLRRRNQHCATVLRKPYPGHPNANPTKFAAMLAKWSHNNARTAVHDAREVAGVVIRHQEGIKGSLPQFWRH